jgi:hypothetical protein
VIADVIKDAFKTILQQASGLQPDLKSILEQLTNAVAPVVEALPSVKAEQLAQDLTTFTKTVRTPAANGGSSASMASKRPLSRSVRSAPLY